MAKALVLLLMLAGAAFADVARGGGTSFEDAAWAGDEPYPVGGAVGSDHYFFTTLSPGYAAVIDRPCENQLGNLSLYSETKELITSNINKTTWSAGSDSQTYKLYFVVALCTGRDWVTVSTENRQDLGNGDAGKDTAGAHAASGGAFPDCCHLSINNSIESGNDYEDMYLLNTKLGTLVTVDTLAPVELSAYSASGTELARKESNLSFMPQSRESYVLVRTTPAFLAGENNTYSLLIEGADIIEPEQPPNSDPGTPAQQQAPATEEKAGAAGKTTKKNKTAAGEITAQEEPAKEKGAIEAISDQIAGTIKRVRDDYMQDTATPEEKQQEAPAPGEQPPVETPSNRRIAAVILILVAVAALLVKRKIESA